MLLWSARAAFPSEFAGFRLTLWDLTLPSSFLPGFCALSPRLPLSDYRRLALTEPPRRRRNRIRLLGTHKVVSWGTLSTDKTCASPGHAHPARPAVGLPTNADTSRPQGPAATHVQASTPPQQLLEPCPQESQHLPASSAWFRGVPAACPPQQDAMGHHHSWPQGLISKGNNGHERGTKVPASATTFCQGASGDPRRAWTPLHPKILAPSGPDTLKKQLSL